MKPFAAYLQDWEKNASTDPYWAVLTSSEHSQWQPEDFFATGQIEIKRLFAYMERHKLELVQRGTALDFGCGTGRLTRALRNHFSKVVGLDISAGMLAEAKKANAGMDISWVHNPHPDLSLFPAASFDFIYSNIVFQHMSPVFQEGYLKEFSRVVRCGSWVIVQIPSKRLTKGLSSLARRLLPKKVKKWLSRSRVSQFFAIEMNTLAQNRVLQVAAECGLQLQHIAYTNSTDPNFCGNLAFLSAKEVAQGAYESPMYFFQKT